MSALRASTVSRYLASAGFSRSDSSSTMIRGWRTYTSGFDARQAGPGRVVVEYVVGDSAHRADSRIVKIRARKLLEDYAEALGTRWNTELKDVDVDPRNGRLVVTEKG